ncbi:MAG: diaminopimelate epimerase [Fimbriimonadaceae bacterium]|nr:diaminopimelate epimerase [Fimbriimonadaceae bacterium]
MARLPFWKAQSLGNDFVLVERGDAEGLDLPDLARRVSVRRFGIGSDGLLVVGPGESAEAQVDLRMFNPDGTEDFCGNGQRCAIAHARSRGWADGEFFIRQHGLLSRAEELPDGRVRTVLPPARFGEEDIPRVGIPNDAVLHGVRGIALSTGSAHFVVPVEQLPGDEEFFRVSPLIETDPAFPESISVIWTLAEGDRDLRLRIWERGAGETLGCGTGSSAAAVVWAAHRSLAGSFRVHNPGGLLEIDLPEGPLGPIVQTSAVAFPDSGILDV